MKVCYNIYILHMFGSVLFTNLTRRIVPLIYLTPLDDFDVAEDLCLAYIEGVKQVGRCLLLL